MDKVGNCKTKKVRFQTFIFQRCCGSEPFNDADKVKKIVNIYQNKNISHFLKECVRPKAFEFSKNLIKRSSIQKVSEDLFKELKLVKDGELDLDAADTYLDTAFQDKKWTEAYKIAAKICQNEVALKLKSIQSKYEAPPFNMNKDDCDVKFMAMYSCITLETFIVSWILWNNRRLENFPSQELSQNIHGYVQRLWLNQELATQMYQKPRRSLCDGNGDNVLT